MLLNRLNPMPDLFRLEDFRRRLARNPQPANTLDLRLTLQILDPAYLRTRQRREHGEVARHLDRRDGRVLFERVGYARVYRDCAQVPILTLGRDTEMENGAPPKLAQELGRVCPPL